MGQIIFLDVDGVLADFVGGACRAHGHDPDVVQGAWPRGVYDIVEVLGVPGNKFWQKIHARGADFWAELRPYAGALSFYEELLKIAPVVLSTSPSLDPSSTAGKVEWILTYFGSQFRDYLIGPPKHALAREGAILIDDFETNVQRFEEHGGQGVLFPQLWNRAHELHGNRYARVLEALNR